MRWGLVCHLTIAISSSLRSLPFDEGRPSFGATHAPRRCRPAPSTSGRRRGLRGSGPSRPPFAADLSANPPTSRPPWTALEMLFYVGRYRVDVSPCKQSASRGLRIYATCPSPSRLRLASIQLCFPPKKARPNESFGSSLKCKHRTSSSALTEERKHALFRTLHRQILSSHSPPSHMHARYLSLVFPFFPFFRPRCAFGGAASSGWSATHRRSMSASAA